MTALAVGLALGLLSPAVPSREAVCSWYGPGFHGELTASGTIYDQNEMTGASRTLPLGTVLEVRRGKRRVEVWITDRGPYVDGRDLDLSAASFKALTGDLDLGVVSATFRVVGRRTEGLRYNLRGGCW